MRGVEAVSLDQGLSKKIICAHPPRVALSLESKVAER